jgi:hypothetical protein
MAIKERLHEMYIQPMGTPVSTAGSSLSTTNTTYCLDTLGFESNMIVVFVGAGSSDWAIGLQDTDTSTSTAGTAVTGKDVIFAVDDNDATVIGTSSAAGQWVQSTGVLTSTASSITGRVLMFAYVGKKRYVRLVATSGSASLVASVISIQGDFRYRGRAGLWTEPYGANTSNSGPTMQ